MMKTTSLQMFGLLLSLLLLLLLLLLRQPWIRLLLASSEAAMEGMLRLAAFHTVATLSGSWLVAAFLYVRLADGHWSVVPACLLLMLAQDFLATLSDLEEAVALVWVVVWRAPLPTSYLTARLTGLGVGVEVLPEWIRTGVVLVGFAIRSEWFL